MAEFEIVRKYQKYHVYSNTGQLIMLTTQKKNRRPIQKF
jgi:hypothetical protein